RPLLQNDNPEAVLRDLFALRDPIYTKLADIVMFTDRKSPRLVSCSQACTPEAVALLA
ncbi:MAG: hypothetical protein HLX50_17520, partial [Alteromonadaceae bacterium]|nr:hypothetical protein [Alteromonadaceae bacterium]